MLMLIFYVGNDRYALDTTNVVEVIPMVVLRDIPHAPQYVAGLFNYRGTIVPVIDLCRLIKGTPSRSALSTRIVMVNYHHHNDTVSLLGLMAERIADTLRHTDVEFADAGFQPEAAPYLGEMIVDRRGMIQRIHVEHLLPESQRSLLLPATTQSSSLENSMYEVDGYLE
jgi:chemotaxis-related protein WspB